MQSMETELERKKEDHTSVIHTDEGRERVLYQFLGEGGCQANTADTIKLNRDNYCTYFLSAAGLYLRG